MKLPLILKKKYSIHFLLMFLILSPISLIGFGLYLQYYEGLAPCPLCTVQRGEFLLISVLSVFTFISLFLFSYKNWFKIFSRIFSGLSILFSLAGIYTSYRHILLQNMEKDEVPSCGPDLSYMLEAFPLMDTLREVFTGSGSCADVDWSFLSLSIPEWSFVWFSIYCLITAFIFKNNRLKN